MADAVADRPDLRGPLRYPCWLARRQLGRVLLGAGYGTAWMVTLALPPYLLSQAIDEGLRADDTAALWRWAGALLGVGIVNAWLAIGRHRTMSRVRIDANFRTTIITVAHRLQTARDADRVAFMSGGQIVEIGSHEELLRNDGPYAALWRAWQGEAAHADGSGDACPGQDGNDRLRPPVHAELGEKVPHVRPQREVSARHRQAVDDGPGDR